MAQWHDEPLDSDPPGSFAGHLVQTLTGGALTMLISLGYRAGLQERYTLPGGARPFPQRPCCFLSGPAAARAAPMAAILQAFAGALPALEECFTTGAGLARAQARPQNCIVVCRPCYPGAHGRAGHYSRKPVAWPGPGW